MITRLTLTKIKRWPTLRRHLAGKSVYIHSNNGFWRPGGHGYTDLTQAGVFDFDDAVSRTHHCGPEKAIEYILVTESCWPMADNRIRMVFDNAARLLQKQFKCQPRWVLVKALTTHGSNLSAQICRQLGWDPDEEL